MRYHHLAAITLATFTPFLLKASDRFDPHAPGNALVGKTFQVPPDSRFVWEAWEGDDRAIERIRISNDPNNVSQLQQSSRVLKRDTTHPDDPNAPSVTHVLKQYTLVVATNADPNDTFEIHCEGRPKDDAAWNFAFTMRVQ